MAPVLDQKKKVRGVYVSAPGPVGGSAPSGDWAYKTREFLERAEQEGRVISVCDDLPRSFVLVGEEKGTATVYISQLSSAALLRRAESNLL